MAVPTITSMQPNQAWFTDPPVTLVLMGTNYDETSQVLWGGQDLDPPETPADEVVLVSPTELHATFNPADATYDDTTMSAEVWVANGPDWSNIMTFNFVYVEPPQPETGGSPNTPAIPATYDPPIPPDVYQKVADPSSNPTAE